jgi:hypothetical protein
MISNDVIENKERVRALLPQSGTRFRTKDISCSPLMLQLFSVREDDKNYHARIGQGLSTDSDYFRVRHVGEENDRGVLWERI